ncbi:MAG: hypothetical protein KGL93_00070, partial [Gemmatimonadota bacterium]|nr:hypothetical protein [Gemmatimonadota bacterium]
PRPNTAAPAATPAKAPPAPPVQAPPPAPGAAPQASSPARALSAPDPSAPEGATLRCKDGTYLTGAQPDAACDAHRGIAARFAPRVAPAVPRPKRP